MSTNDETTPDEPQFARAERLLLRYAHAQSAETLVEWLLGHSREDAAFREELLRRARAGRPSADEARRRLRGILAGEDEGGDRNRLAIEAMLALYDEGGGESLLPLLREVIGARGPFLGMEGMQVTETAFEVAAWIMEDARWSSLRRLSWYVETRLLTGADFVHYTKDFVPPAAEWSHVADELLAQLEKHVLVWDDPLELTAAEVLQQAGRADEAYALIVRGSPITGHWFHAVFILENQPPDWQRAFARPLLALIRQWEGPEDVREHALECLEEFLGEAMRLQVAEA